MYLAPTVCLPILVYFEARLISLSCTNPSLEMFNGGVTGVALWRNKAETGSDLCFPLTAGTNPLTLLSKCVSSVLKVVCKCTFDLGCNCYSIQTSPIKAYKDVFAFTLPSMFMGAPQMAPYSLKVVRNLGCTPM